MAVIGTTATKEDIDNLKNSSPVIQQANFQYFSTFVKDKIRFNVFIIDDSFNKTKLENALANAGYALEWI